MALSNQSQTENFKHEVEEDWLAFVLEKMSSTVFPMALRSAIELGVFNILAKAGEGAKLSAKEIVVQIGSNNPEAPNMLDRVLRLLASNSLLYCTISEEEPQRYYSLCPASKYFVPDAEGISMGPAFALVVDNVYYQSWSELTGAIREGGIPFNRVYGMHAFEYLSVDHRFNEVFNKAMINLTTTIMKRILEVYQGFEHVTNLVDVGGGLGVNLKLITSKYPNLHGINFDLPHVIQRAHVYPGVEHVGGDMFECVPTGDAILMKSVLHDWSDEQCLKLLKNCYKAIPEDGKMIVVDSVLPIVPEKTTTAKNGFASDLLMMTQSSGGKDRTQQEFIDLAKGSGFSGITFICSVSGYWVMEFFK